MFTGFLTGLSTFAPLIGGAISAIGALFAPKPKPHKEVTKTESGIDLVKLRDEAVRAGFNPLTVMRSGGVMGFSYGTTTTRLPALPDMRLSNALGYLGAGVSAFSYDPFREERHKMDMRLGEAQIASFNRSGLDASGGGGAYGFGGAPGSEFSFFADLFKLAKGAGSDAETVEQRYGEFASEVAGIGNLITDGWLAFVNGAKSLQNGIPVVSNEEAWANVQRNWAKLF